MISLTERCEVLEQEVNALKQEIERLKHQSSNPATPLEVISALKKSGAKVLGFGSYLGSIPEGEVANSGTDLIYPWGKVTVTYGTYPTDYTQHGYHIMD